MSSWWNIDFSVGGDDKDIRGLLEQLESMEFSPEAIDPADPIHVRAGRELFHGGIKVKGRAPGWASIHTSRNYRGDEAVCDLISRFPKLRFVGCVHSDMSYGNGGEYTTLFGIGGSMYVERRIDPIEDDIDDAFDMDMTGLTMNTVAVVALKDKKLKAMKINEGNE